MSQLLARGGRRLEGEVAVQGAKNSVLPILAATLLTEDRVELRGCPRLRDVDASIRILKSLGCEARWEGDSLLVDTAGLKSWSISDERNAVLRHFPGGYSGPVLPGGFELSRRL